MVHSRSAKHVIKLITDKNSPQPPPQKKVDNVDNDMNISVDLKGLCQREATTEGKKCKPGLDLVVLLEQ